LFTVIQDNREDSGDDRPDDLPRLLYSPAPGFHLFWYGGRPMWIQRDIAMNLQVIETVKVSALLASRRLLEEMLEDVIRRAYARMADHTPLYTIDRWGESWNLAGARPRRHIASVVLDGDTREKLLADVKEFFGRRQWYTDLGIPWRRGYLLHGPPGTGKTSFAYALAGELHLKLCALSLTNSKLNDQTISDLLQKTPPRALILIEDIDAFFVARDKQDTRIEVSFSGLLNALDGVAAQEGRIVFLTTNHLDRLDKALIRPGRVDVVAELGNASSAMLRTMFLRFYPQSAASIDPALARYADRSLSPARIQQALLESDDPADALRLLGLS
jgi:chaperone BCS1